MSTEGSGQKHYGPPTNQADATINQANPVSGQYYTILAATANVRLDSVAVNCTWTVQPTPLNVRITIDGIAYVYVQADPVSTQNYLPVTLPNLAPGGANVMRVTAGNLGDTTVAFPIGFSFKSVTVEAAITGGTVQALAGRVKYSKW